MSVTFGFFNSLNGDRKYNAEQVSSLFDGLINDGIYMSIGNKLMVEPSSGMTIKVGSGRAWFNHTWTLNDSDLLLTLDEPEVIRNRIDAVVLEINSTESVRENNIKIVKGSPATNPVRPTLTNTDYIHQHPLAYITVNKDAIEITTANITNMVGTSETPFVTGVIQSMNIDNLIAQWQAEWENIKQTTIDENTQWTDAQREAWLTWSEEQEQELISWILDRRSEFELFQQEQTEYIESYQESSKQDFEDWFDELRIILDGEVASHLQNEIDEINEREFNHFYELINKTTRINKDVRGNILSIQESSNEGTALTTFAENNNHKIITTMLTPLTGNWDYRKVADISHDNNGTLITETITKIGKQGGGE